MDSLAVQLMCKDRVTSQETSFFLKCVHCDTYYICVQCVYASVGVCTGKRFPCVCDISTLVTLLSLTSLQAKRERESERGRGRGMILEIQVKTEIHT